MPSSTPFVSGALFELPKLFKKRDLKVPRFFRRAQQLTAALVKAPGEVLSHPLSELVLSHSCGVVGLIVAVQSLLGRIQAACVFLFIEKLMFIIY